jgi:hypothetical protein
VSGLRCNQKFFGQEHFERGTARRKWLDSLGVLKPTMMAYDFAVRDRLPSFPSGEGGMVQVKYNGMLSILIWNEERGFVAWSPRGRCYCSLEDGRKHPVTEYLNKRSDELKDYLFVGETHVTREGLGKKYMTEFSTSMSIIKNPRKIEDVGRIQLAIFDYRIRDGVDGFKECGSSYMERFAGLRDKFSFPVGVDNGPIHLPDYVEVDDFESSRQGLQEFWNEYIGERGFEGFVMHTSGGDEYKIKFRDTLDVAVIAFRENPDSSPHCPSCGADFDLINLIQHIKNGKLDRDEWFDGRGRQVRHVRKGGRCPLCSAKTVPGPGPVLGAKIALMTPEGEFVDVADGAQLSHLSPILWEIEPLYRDGGYLWVRPEVVIEISYQDLYVGGLRSLYKFEGDMYVHAGKMEGVCLRPYFRGIREDKTVNPRDLRLEQVNYLVGRIDRIRKLTGE